eukprot:1161190-Pelagomonas_calceolata.AAC.4
MHLVCPSRTADGAIARIDSAGAAPHHVWSSECRLKKGEEQNSVMGPSLYEPFRGFSNKSCDEA